MSKLKEFIELVGEAPATDDHLIIQTLNSAEIELETLALRLNNLIKKSHNSPVQNNSSERQQRDQAKEAIYNNLHIISNLLEKI